MASNFYIERTFSLSTREVERTGASIAQATEVNNQLETNLLCQRIDQIVLDMLHRQDRSEHIDDPLAILWREKYIYSWHESLFRD